MGRDETRAPLKTPAWEAIQVEETKKMNGFQRLIYKQLIVQISGLCGLQFLSVLFAETFHAPL